MLKHNFGPDFQALGKRRHATNEELPEVEGLTEEDYEALWERMRTGEDYGEIRKLLKEEGLSDEDIKVVMHWLDDEALRYFPMYQEFKKVRFWVYVGLGLMVVGMVVAWQARQNGYEGLLIMVPFIAGIVVFVLNWGKYRKLRQQV